MSLKQQLIFRMGNTKSELFKKKYKSLNYEVGNSQKDPLLGLFMVLKFSSNKNIDYALQRIINLN